EGDGLELQTTVESHPGDVLQQTGNLGITGQLLEQGAEPVLDLDQLLLVSVQVGSLEGLVRELLAQGGFLGFGALELRLKVLEMELIAEKQKHCEQQRCHNDLECTRPGPDIVEVKVVEIDLLQTFHGLSKTHCCCSPSAAFVPGSVARSDLAGTFTWSNAPWGTASTAISLGAGSQSGASI